MDDESWAGDAGDAGHRSTVGNSHRSPTVQYELYRLVAASWGNGPVVGEPCRYQDPLVHPSWTDCQRIGPFELGEQTAVTRRRLTSVCGPWRAAMGVGAVLLSVTKRFVTVSRLAPFRPQ